MQLPSTLLHDWGFAQISVILFDVQMIAHLTLEKESILHDKHSVSIRSHGICMSGSNSQNSFLDFMDNKHKSYKTQTRFCAVLNVTMAPTLSATVS